MYGPVFITNFGHLKPNDMKTKRMIVALTHLLLLPLFGQSQTTKDDVVLNLNYAKVLSVTSQSVDTFNLNDADLNKIVLNRQLLVQCIYDPTQSNIPQISWPLFLSRNDTNYYTIKDTVVKWLVTSADKYLVLPLNKLSKKNIVINIVSRKTQPSSTFLNYLSYTLYTDFRGYYSAEPNGLVQNQIDVNIPLFSESASSIAKRNQREASQLFYLDNVLFQLNFFQTQSDSNKYYKLLNYAQKEQGIVKHIHTLDLIKHCNVSIITKINLVKFHFPSIGLTIWLDALGAYYNTPVYDTLGKSRTYNLTSLAIGNSVKFMFRPEKSRIKAEISYAQARTWLMNNDVKQRYGQLYEPENPLNNNFNSSQPFNKVGAFSFEIRYSSTINKQNTNNSGIFFRTNIFTNPILLADSKTNDYNNTYVQMQLGISKTIEELLSFLKW